MSAESWPTAAECRGFVSCNPLAADENDDPSFTRRGFARRLAHSSPKGYA